MPGWSRRRALQAVATAGAAALAGCEGETSRSGDALSDRRDRVTDYEAVHVRQTDDEPVFVTSDYTPATNVRPRGLHHLTDEEGLEDIQFRDVPGAAALESFVAATDFESASVYLLQRQVGECYEPLLVGVFREGDGVDAQFCRELRPADADCDAEAHDTYAVAIRLPFPGDDFDSRGTGSSSSCNHEQAIAIPEAASADGGSTDGGDDR